MAWSECPLCKGSTEVRESKPDGVGGLISYTKECPVCAEIDRLKTRNARLAKVLRTMIFLAEDEE